MENTNENVVNEVKQEEVNNAAVELNAKSSDKKLITKIVVGVLIFLAVIGIAVFVFWFSLVNKIVDEGKDSINSIVNMGQSLVDDALEESDLEDKLKENMNKLNSNVTNNNDSNSKTAITADKFCSIMQAKGYEVGDFTSQFAQYGDYAKKVCAARKTGYQIEFFELANESNAIESYNTNKTKFESQKGNISSYFTVSKNNYNTYTLTTNGQYKYICRVDNTFIYADVAEEYKDEVKNIINELGY